MNRIKLNKFELAELFEIVKILNVNPKELIDGNE